MKMRKLFAGIAAAATLLGGMALGAASAQADGSGTVVKSDVNFTFTAQDAKQLTNRSLNAYKIADYVQYGTDDNATYGVQTADGVDRGTLKTALESATGKTVSETGDLMAWALAEGVLSVDNSADGAWNNSASRKFVESLKTTTDKLGTVQKVDLGAVANGTSATVQLPAGLYLFVDADYSVGTNEAATPSIAILVGSGNVKDGVLNPLTKGGMHIADQLGQPYAQSFKTLVMQGKSKEYYVFVLPVDKEVDLKKAAHVVGEKSLAMVHVKDIQAVTGYIRGGCTSIGMKKKYRTVIHESAREWDTVIVSGGRLGSQILLSPDDLVKAVDGEMADIVFCENK